MNFYTHEAIPLSKIVIFFGSLSSFFLNLKLTHPLRNTKALDFNMIILICPNLLMGTVLGVNLNKILHNVIIIFLLTLLLFYNTYKTYKVGMKEYENENLFQNKISVPASSHGYLINQNNSNLNSSNNNMNINNDNNNDNNNNSNNNNNNIISNALNDPIQEEINKELEKDKKFLRWDKQKYIIIPFIIMAFLSILRESNITPKCSLSYWFLFILFFILSLIIDYMSLLHVQHEYNYRISIAFPYDEKDINWTFDKSLKISLTGLISGFIAGIIGIGGGVVLGPILLSMGIYPVVSTVTTNFLVLITSSSTTLQFILFNMLNFEYAFISVFFSSLGSIFGTLLIQSFFKKSGRQSYLVFALFAVIGISAIVLPISSIISTLHDIEKGVNVFTFHNLC